MASWGSCLITRLVLAHSTRGFAEGKQYEINPRFSSIETLTAGSGFTGNSQALWKSLLFKNLIFFRFLAAELKQLREYCSPDQSSSGCEATEDNIVCLSPCAPGAHKPTFQRSYLAIHQAAAVHLSVSLCFLLLSSTDWQLFSPRCKSFDEREYAGTFSSYFLSSWYSDLDVKLELVCLLPVCVALLHNSWMCWTDSVIFLLRLRKENLSADNIQSRKVNLWEGMTGLAVPQGKHKYIQF